MRSIALLLVGSLAVAACAATTDDDANEESDPGLTESAVTSLDPQRTPEVALTDPPVLRALEAKGYGFGHHFGKADDAKADALMGSPAYAAIAKGIIANLSALQAADRQLGVGMARDHRMFDPKWLSSNRSRYVLTAVTNRLDRAPFAGSCGETRFVYRLEYADPREGASSRMPMTVAVVLPQAPRAGEAGCAATAKRWLALGGTSGAGLADAAARGPLASLPPRMAIETNLQAVRWPSSVKKDLGGEGEYMMSVWDVAADGAVTASRLDNTPDVAAIAKDGAKKAALLDWVKKNAAAIDRGTAKLPEELTATTAYSFGPRGLARLANRPFTALLDGADLGATSGGVHVKSAAGLLRKLDGMSCQGCHQSRAMAGFHVLGNEDDMGTNDKLNRLTVGTSPHFNEELGWRQRLAQAVANGADPASFPEARPFADHATSDGLSGASCGLDRDATFSGWTCKPGLYCADMIGEPHVGVCVSTKLKAGDACEKDRITSSAESPRTDSVQNLDSGDNACAKAMGGACSGASGGFPGGSCAGACAKMGVLKDNVICGAAPPAGFNECMGAGNRTFEQCMSPPKLSLRQACSVTLPCRDDYVCAFVPGAPAGVGACMPPYFIFQARVDGHD